MTGTAQLMWDDGVSGYDFGPGHPMAPVRLGLTKGLITAFGLDGELRMVAARAAGESTLRLVHRDDYIEAVKAASIDPASAYGAYGIGTIDDPAFAGMHEASALIAGQSVAAAEAVWRGEAAHAVNFTGGLHHAMPGAAAGFCVYNDAALAIARLLELGVERVAYVDVDVHHGDGVQTVFWDDPRVLTISLHESPYTLPFPGTGRPEETGGAAAEGSAVNVALPAGTSDAGWLRAFHAVVPELVADFRPQVLVTQHGADTHVEDPLAHLAVSLDAQRAVQLACHELAHEHAEGRWVALGGGGYAVVDVVPRSWTHLVAIAAGRPIEPETPLPERWRADVLARRGLPPDRMTDGRWPVSWTAWEEGYDPASRVDQAIRATREVVFPLRGLLP